MTHKWFECSIRYEKTIENGSKKKMTEKYLIDALSFTEAETRIIEEMTPFIDGEFTVTNIKHANYSELFFTEEDEAVLWYKCKLVFITLDEKSGVEKKTSTQVLVQAADLRDAVKKLDEGMKGTMADYYIASIVETPIMDVYAYKCHEDKREGDKEQTATELLSSCRDGEKTEVVVRGQKVIVDKTGKNTVVRTAICDSNEKQSPD